MQQYGRSTIQHYNNTALLQNPIPSAFPATSLGYLQEKLYLCISEDSPCPSIGDPTARRFYAKRNSKLYFCADKLRSPSKSHLANFYEAGVMSPRNSVTFKG